jgi:hypothetical protein
LANNSSEGSFIWAYILAADGLPWKAQGDRIAATRLKGPCTMALPLPPRHRILNAAVTHLSFVLWSTILTTMFLQTNPHDSYRRDIQILVQENIAVPNILDYLFQIHGLGLETSEKEVRKAIQEYGLPRNPRAVQSNINWAKLLVRKTISLEALNTPPASQDDASNTSQASQDEPSSPSNIPQAPQDGFHPSNTPCRTMSTISTIMFLSECAT